MTDPIETLFLRDTAHGGSSTQLATVSQALYNFVAAARQTLDIAIYDFRLYDEVAEGPAVTALLDAAQRGVTVRIGYDAGKPADGTAEEFALLPADPATIGTGDWLTHILRGTALQYKAIKADGQLMHSKFIVRDNATVWTGSTNFTDDAWTRQENNVIVVDSAAINPNLAATSYQPRNHW